MKYRKNHTKQIQNHKINRRCLAKMKKDNRIRVGRIAIFTRIKSNAKGYLYAEIIKWPL